MKFPDEEKGELNLLQERLFQFFERECSSILVEPILVGVSGGPDSLCLLDLLVRSGRNVIAAHFDHQLREDSPLEGEQVEKIASGYGIPFISGVGDVITFTKVNRISLEEGARKLRYQFLFAKARESAANSVAVAHNADDQVETILMHFIRGSGLSGLKGMLPVTRLPEFDHEISVIRPLLQVWRSEVLDYCQDMNFHPVIDPTNQDQTYFRNYLRHKIIPELELHNPNIRVVLQRSASSLAGDYLLIQDLIEQKYAQVLMEEGEGFIAFDLLKLQKESIPVLRNLLRKTAYRLKVNLRDLDFDNLERAVKFIKEKYSVAKRIDLTGGIQIFGIGDRLYIADQSATIPLNEWPQIDGIIKLRNNASIEIGKGWSISSQLIDLVMLPEGYQVNQDPFIAWVDANEVSETLEVRSRVDGDRFQPIGMDSGTLKLSDIFINYKIPRQARSHWPLVCMDGEIVWIPGVCPAQNFKVTEKTRKILQISVSRV